MEHQGPQCAKCAVLRCRSKETDTQAPSFCPTETYRELIDETAEKLMLPENRAINDAWLGYIGKVMDPCQPREKFAWTRVDEIMEYARQRGMKKMEIQPLQRRRMQPDNPAKDFPAA